MAGWPREADRAAFIDVNSFAEELQLEDEDPAILAFQLDQQGLVHLLRTAGTTKLVRLSDSGRVAVRQLKDLQKDRAARIQHTMDALLRWLFDTVSDQTPVDPALFLATPGSYFAGTEISASELHQALAYLAEHKLIEHIDTDPATVAITPQGTRCALAGGSVQDHVNQPRPGTRYNNFMPNAKGVIIGEQQHFTQNNTEGVDPTLFAQLAGYVGQVSSTLDMPDADRAELERVAQDLHDEATSENPEPGRLRQVRQPPSRSWRTHGMRATTYQVPAFNTSPYGSTTRVAVEGGEPSRPGRSYASSTARSAQTARARSGSSSGVDGSRNQAGASRWKRRAADSAASRTDGSRVAVSLSRAVCAASHRPRSCKAVGSPDRNRVSASLGWSVVSRVRQPGARKYPPARPRSDRTGTRASCSAWTSRITVRSETSSSRANAAVRPGFDCNRRAIRIRRAARMIRASPLRPANAAPAVPRARAEAPAGSRGIAAGIRRPPREASARGGVPPAPEVFATRVPSSADDAA